MRSFIEPGENSCLVSVLRDLRACDNMPEPGGERRLTAVEIFAKYDEDGSNLIDVDEIEV